MQQLKPKYKTRKYRIPSSHNSIKKLIFWPTLLSQVSLQEFWNLGVMTSCGQRFFSPFMTPSLSSHQPDIDRAEESKHLRQNRLFSKKQKHPHQKSLNINYCSLCLQSFKCISFSCSNGSTKRFFMTAECSQDKTLQQKRGHACSHYHEDFGQNQQTPATIPYAVESDAHLASFFFPHLDLENTGMLSLR